MDLRIEAIIDLIDKNFADPSLQCKNFARSVSLSSRRLEELFKDQTGSTLMQHIKLRRLQTAAVLLTTQFISVKETAVLVGYNSYSHFIHDFKRHFGMAPRRYTSGQMREIRRSGR
jgi:AraC family transcriptional regulator, arabinose operon regulatory protein